ncbi:hypothetical protein MBRA1_002634 [Malassezia brasiliensis]|uniref:Uncharacterized protein n=1 Tax=Malassezia brasiliensis TaxID=1821822 RepID=A0AAF0DV17_9BASI|nr:hypothetical protein MBRA1_002634 [Malassezia brasiliensis]
MATLGDYIGLGLILALVYAIYMGIQHTDDAKRALNEKKQELKVRRAPSQLTQAHGIDISSEGISIRSNHRSMDRSAYIDATQKKFSEGGAFLAEHANSMKFGPGGDTST